MRLVIAEKPSVARDLARVLGASRRGDGFLEGDGVRITWCVGHLVELVDPSHYDAAWKRWSLDTLPMVPASFELRPRGGAKDQWAVVKRLLRDRGVDQVVNACDAGREGELIFRYVYELAGAEAPVVRLWVSSLTDEAIRAGWARLRPAERFDALADAARCRSEADWLVGLNATRAMTCRARQAGGDALWSVGRVQTPTLAMIVGRDLDIDAFVPETFWQVKTDVVAQTGTWSATWFRVRGDQAKAGHDEVPHAQRLTSVEAAEAVVAACAGRAGIVAHAERKATHERPPQLYDLTSLQRRANQRYGLSAGRTLEVAQALYEKHKLITYPRTDARVLASDQVPGLPDVLRGVGGLGVYAPFVDELLASELRIDRRLVDDDEVGDHHAIIPTGRVPDARRLTPDEKRVFDLVARRLLAALSPDAILERTELIVEVDADPGVTLPDDVPTPLTFRARGRVVRQVGWRAVDPPKQRKDLLLPLVPEGAPVTIVDPAVHEGQTRPPRPHDDASILGAMEGAGKDLDDAALKRAMRGSGLGTPATRAAILKTLVDRDYVVRDGKALRSTEKGRALIEMVPSGDLTSAELTGRWEKRLHDMAEGRERREVFMADVVSRLRGVVSEIASVEVGEVASRRTRPEGRSLGTCPACGEPVRARGTVFTCDTGRSCPFVVFGEMSGRKIGVRMVRALLKDGRTDRIDGFKSRKGAPFSAGLQVGEDGKVGFWFDDGPAPSSEPAAPAAAPARVVAQPEAVAAPEPTAPPAGMSCPRCGQGVVVTGNAAWGCSRWRERCAWRLPFVDADGRPLSPEAAVAAVRS